MAVQGQGRSVVINRLEEYFDSGALQRGRDYARRGHVIGVKAGAGGVLRAQVSNGRGEVYEQQIEVERDWIEGHCSCPVEYNCKHVVAALIEWQSRGQGVPGLTSSVQSWLARVREAAVVPQTEQPRPEGYPEAIKDRLLYVLQPDEPQLKIDIYKGRINTAGTGLNKSMRRYDAMHLLRNADPAGFIRPVDFELLSALAQARIWEAHYAYGLPDQLRPRGGDAAALVQRLCQTGRFFHTNLPDACLTWSDGEPTPQLAWHVNETGTQSLCFEDEAGQELALLALEGGGLWIDTDRGQIGGLSVPVDASLLRLVKVSPEVVPDQAELIAQKLPPMMGAFALPAPRGIARKRRSPAARIARLTLSTEAARDGDRYWGSSVQLPTLSVEFLYDGRQASPDGAEPVVVEDGVVITLARDAVWEEACLARLRQAGAVSIEELDQYWPGERLMACDFALVAGEMNPETFGVVSEDDILDFAFRLVPQLRRDGWEVLETKKWPYRLSDEAAPLTVSTQVDAGETFQGSDWFSLGFQIELGGKAVDVAPLVAAFLQQLHGQWDDTPDLDILAQHLAAHPVFLDRGKQGYVALNLSPIAPLLHLFLTHHAELGALHPSDAAVARLTEDALSGSGVRFADHAGILPLARSLEALAQAGTFRQPKGLNATLRDYQAFGAAWMGSLLEAGFGGVLADDMGLGKTVQTLALLQARKEAGAAGPALLIVPTSLIYSWQAQASQFTPDLSIVVLHGPGRAALQGAARAAELVVTTYPLLARDRDWLAGQDWPLVILDEAQTLKNPASQMAKTLRDIPAAGRLALTGTPLENSLQDLWTLMDWVNPGLLGDRKRFQSTFRTPIERGGDRSAQARLNRRLRPFMLRRSKENVASELPPKTEILDRVDLPRAQQALYETVRSAMDARVREAVQTRGLSASRITVLDALLKLRQVCCDPALVKTEAAKGVMDSAKRARLRELLAELVAEGRRVLVFSQFVQMLHLIENDLAGLGIPYLSLTGQTRNRSDVLKEFAEGDAPVFLLSLKAGGVGLTLTQADTVILYDPWWNPAVERQAMDRTHRIGQDKPVFVYRLVAAGTVEEKILDMQVRKQALADALFEDGDTGTDTLLDETTLQDLFAPLES